MATCARCGFLVRGPRERCENCGAPLPPRARADLEAAVRAASAEAPPPAPKPPWRRRIAVAAGLVALAWVGLHLAAVVDDRNSLPFEPGTRWTFDVEGLPGTALTLTIGADAETGRLVRVDTVENGVPVPLGVAYAKLGWRGAYVLGVQRAGDPEPEVEAVRVLPFPSEPGDEWSEKVGPSRFRLRFQTDALTEVGVPAGRYQALPVRFELAPPVGPVLLKGSYHVARGVGPVKITLDAPGEFHGLRTLDLRLARLER